MAVSSTVFALSTTSTIVKSVDYDRLVSKVDRSSEERREQDMAVGRNPTQLYFVPCLRKNLHNCTVVSDLNLGHSLSCVKLSWSQSYHQKSSWIKWIKNGFFELVLQCGVATATSPTDTLCKATSALVVRALPWGSFYKIATAGSTCSLAFLNKDSKSSPRYSLPPASIRSLLCVSWFVW
jgi:hypothetical protein